ncbi:hypothetical protein ALC53_05848 [Atta colombica]|uniref:Uncharacterized protein n=1 Tax=Atta colombica TaxID=520822 RepID=A0A151I495_9HYME|nr:hypothetical protein ALC53_05848 [Atta colombica]
MRAEAVWEVRDKRFFSFVLSLSSFNKLARRFGQYLREKRLSTGRGVTGSSKLRCGPGLSSRPEIKQCLANECRSDGQTAQQQEAAQRWYLPIRNYHSEAIQGMIWSAISFSSVWSQWYYMCLRVLDQLGLAFLAEFNFPESTTVDRRGTELQRTNNKRDGSSGKRSYPLLCRGEPFYVQVTTGIACGLHCRECIPRHAAGTWTCTNGFRGVTNIVHCDILLEFHSYFELLGDDIAAYNLSPQLSNVSSGSRSGRLHVSPTTAMT